MNWIEIYHNYVIIKVKENKHMGDFTKSFNFKLIITFTLLFYASYALPNNPLLVRNQLQDALNHYRTSKHIVGMSMHVMSYRPRDTFSFTINSGKVARKSNIKINHDNLFQAGSITKSFTAATLLRLEANPKLHLNLNQKIRKWLPQYKKWRNVTIRQLLNHTSGIYNYVRLILNNTTNQYPNKQWTLPQLASYYEAAPIGVQPGTFGHAGAGGSMAFYDPEAKIGFCFAMNQMQAGVVTGGVSAMKCAEAIYA